VTLSVPVMVWDLLPEHPACSFIGYIASPNKYSPGPKSRTGSMGGYASPFKYYITRRRNPDGNLRSADSSYGSDGGSESEEP
jgi:hypothetical protein